MRGERSVSWMESGSLIKNAWVKQMGCEWLERSQDLADELPSDEHTDPAQSGIPDKPEESLSHPLAQKQQGQAGAVERWNRQEIEDAQQKIE